MYINLRACLSVRFFSLCPQLPVELLPVRELEQEHRTLQARAASPGSVRCTTDLHRTLSLCSKKDLPFLRDEASRALLFGYAVF